MYCIWEENNFLLPFAFNSHPGGRILKGCKTPLVKMSLYFNPGGCTRGPEPYSFFLKRSPLQHLISPM